ncbi:MAG: phospho-sugar mutase [Oscillospiraceae bacterium]|jgi:phosphoglucomutase|nr:phospho-sugar mutase [Oscillospiraceae bacterium]
MSAIETYNKWLQQPELIRSGERDELLAIADDAAEIESRFYGSLEFGTAGLRGIMGLGTARINVYTVRHATQAFAEVILADGTRENPSVENPSVAICYDSRNNSARFAREAACVLAGNGIHALIFDGLRPTPELSFAIREYGCVAGINITASHNTKEYNGYKVYWSDGAQLPPHRAAEVAARMAELDVFACVRSLNPITALADDLITVMGADTDELFLSRVMAQANDFAAVASVADEFSVVYTPFHGAGYKLVPEALRRLGVKRVFCVPEQMVIDGDFPTVVSPNPENPDGFALAIKLAREHDADFIIGTDPDCDRVGIMLRGADGEYSPLSGNRTGVLLLDYLIGARRRAGTMPPNPVALKTIVTTEMARRVAEMNGVCCIDTFTGFKFMAERKNALESSGEGNVIFSYEESYGYMLGDFVRDKDAVTASLLLTEMAAWYRSRGMTLEDALAALFEKYGYYAERTVNLVMPGLDGMARMKALMQSLRGTPPLEIAGVSVVSRRDYDAGTEFVVATGETTELELRGSNVLRYDLEGGTTVLVRPSGTEPKIKVYILASGASADECDAQLEKFAAWAEGL